jgi:hypothetical protein
VRHTSVFVLWLRGEPVSANTQAFDECPLARAAAKKEGSFAKEIGDVRGELQRSEAVTFFHLFFAASSGASNCDLRIGAAGRRDVWDWIGSLKGELFSTGKLRALMICSRVQESSRSRLLCSASGNVKGHTAWGRKERGVLRGWDWRTYCS